MLMVVVAGVYGCKGPKKKGEGVVFREGKGGVWLGGKLSYAENELSVVWLPHAITDVVSWRIATQVFEGLVRYNPVTMEVEPAIAERYEVDTSGTRYVFYLRKGVYFHDSKVFPEGRGREVSAEDVVYSLVLACTRHPENYLFESTFKGVIKGATDYYEGRASVLEGVRAVGDSAVEIELEKPNALFLYYLAGPAGYVIPREAVEEQGGKYRLKEAVGTGPFRVLSAESDRIILVRNEHYWRTDRYGNRLPYVDTVEVVRLPKRELLLGEFIRGNLSFVSDLSTEEIVELETYGAMDTPYIKYSDVWQVTPMMTVQMYVFNTAVPPFNNLALRKAINYLIDRKDLLERVLQGAGYKVPARYGVVPPGVFEGYDALSLKGYDRNVEEARKWLARAGYPDGKGLDTIEILVNSGGGRHLMVADAIKQYLAEPFGIPVRIKTVSFSELIDRVKRGEFTVARYGWVADYPHPATFLSLFYGRGVKPVGEPSYPNSSRYRNAEFDRLYEEAISILDRKRSYSLLLQAEQIALDDAPVAVLWYEENFLIPQPFVKGLHLNPMEYLDLAQVYIDAQALEKWLPVLRARFEKKAGAPAS